MTIIDGQKISREIKEELKIEIDKLKTKPKLVVILVGENKSSAVYVGMKEKACAEIGIEGESIRMSEKTTEEELINVIEKLNEDKTVTGILCQLPLPKHIDENVIIGTISPKKDVDCFHPENVGLLVSGKPFVMPCTPMGVMELLKRYNIEIAGKHVVIIGRSNIVGKPLFHLMLAENATVTITHSKTKKLKEICKTADILCAAIGRAEFVRGDYIKEGATVIDIGVNRMDDGSLKGDVCFTEASHAEYITPVPKGVGPMTIAMLMKNTLALYKAKN